MTNNNKQISNKYNSVFVTCVSGNRAIASLCLLSRTEMSQGRLRMLACECACVCPCVRSCAKQCTFLIPPRSPVWTYQNGWPEEDGPPGERQFVLYIITIIHTSRQRLPQLKMYSFKRNQRSDISRLELQKRHKSK